MKFAKGNAFVIMKLLQIIMKAWKGLLLLMSLPCFLNEIMSANAETKQEYFDQGQYPFQDSNFCFVGQYHWQGSPRKKEEMVDCFNKAKD